MSSSAGSPVTEEGLPGTSESHLTPVGPSACCILVLDITANHPHTPMMFIKGPSNQWIDQVRVKHVHAMIVSAVASR